MSLHAGFGGNVRVVGTDATMHDMAQVAEWEFELENEVLEGEVMQTQFVRKEYGLGNATGSITVLFDESDTEGQQRMEQAALNKEKVELELVRPDGSAWSGTFVIGTLTNPVATNELVEQEFEIECDGAPELIPAGSGATS